jgi:hypothetical protein
MEVKICYFGAKRSGKSSIISHVFQGMKPEDTLKIEPTPDPRITVYDSRLLRIVNWEIPGKIESFEKLSPKDFELLKTFDIFIYIYDLRTNDSDPHIKTLKNYFKILTIQNPNFHFYCFFHQSDLDFLHMWNQIEERITVFRTKFENMIQQEGINSRALDQKYTKRTNIYDLSIKAG